MVKSATILLPIYNRIKLLKHQLLSLCRQDIVGDPLYCFDVCILNEGSRYGLNELKDLFQGRLSITIIDTFQSKPHIDHWRCPSKALNIGAKQSKSGALILGCPEMFLIEKNILKLMIDSVYENKYNIPITKGVDDKSHILSKLENIVSPFIVIDNSKQIRADKNANIAHILTRMDAYMRQEIIQDCRLCLPLKTEYPFYMGVNRDLYNHIGGYDEDFVVGISYDDNDFVERLKLFGCHYVKFSETVVHLFHERPHIVFGDRQRHNIKLYNDRKGTIYRNGAGPLTASPKKSRRSRRK